MYCIHKQVNIMNFMLHPYDSAVNTNPDSGFSMAKEKEK
jgi:hypothetical protein